MARKSVPEPVVEAPPEPLKPAAIEPVLEPGPIKHIHFDAPSGWPPSPAPGDVAGESLEAAPAARPPTVVTTTVAQPARALAQPLSDIHREVDHLGHPRGSWIESSGRRIERRTLYETSSGSVTEARSGSHRALLVGRRTDGHEEEHRFLHSMVDRVIAGVKLEEETIVTETVTEMPSQGSSTYNIVAPQLREARAPAVTVTHDKAWSPEDESASAPSASEYRPQCAAITEGAMQCRNSARGGSKYCASHKGYRPISMDEVIERKDTAPQHAVAQDILPGETAIKEGEHNPQCAAYTAEGLQCRNSARGNAKYCASHKGYKAPSRADLKAGLDTKPRWAQAKDTKPTLAKAKKGKASK